MFEGLDLKNMGKMVEQMQEKAQDIQEQSKNISLTAKGGGGLVEVTVNGAGEVTDVSIDDLMMDDKTSMQIMLISTVNEAIKMAESNKKSQAMSMFGGINPFGTN